MPVQAVQSVSICMESCQVGRLNRLLRRVEAPHLRRLAVYISPDDPELQHMVFLELCNVPLVHLHIANSCGPPTPCMQADAVH
jgi:hypothetical protein